ncbi:MAG: phosphate ABC transporter ATP-binding protein [Acetomicrobium sp.]|uniref:Phosphate ABC transporter, ATP-binding protein n=2 Tax=Acetomicrobium hydrogeniformans TaxID=649746 RepID=A0A0T5XAC1_9BACT|nr:phosphate ABC transporter ATP-binding protein PstB [Acetomicrobium hydrogeniformans]KRT35325.1 phosphate ABC transporter, ATP-binding protein [Acetomicrobium hydrogeniformans ATCC BAA-1850]MBC7322490.1 phosphate ABC transporter ATP-binding protein [Acetomicrobium sp.]HHZ04562.1 phosphate ABC transporter ATP-binding protein [Acetomicrobium hydrogeniformans]
MSDITRDVMKVKIENLFLYYEGVMALKNINMKIPNKSVTALIGPSGCGKSSLLRCLNRMNDFVPNAKVEGRIYLDDTDIYSPGMDLIELRKKVGMVFQRPNPFPMSIYDNVAFGPRLHGVTDRSRLDEIVENSLKASALWDEVKDILTRSALSLSGGQQQRLCVARAIAVNPEVLLMDEPTSALDPMATARIEQLIRNLKNHFTIVIVTHNMQQAARISDVTAFLLMGELVEMGPTEKIFTSPEDQRTADYITGRFG